MNLYIGNLDYGVTNEMLQEYFEAVGEVSSAKIITDKITGRSRGFAFVEMPNDAEGQKAIAELNGGVVEGRNINVTEARPREEKSNNNNKRSFSNNNSRW